MNQQSLNDKFTFKDFGGKEHTLNTEYTYTYASDKGYAPHDEEITIESILLDGTEIYDAIQELSLKTERMEHRLLERAQDLREDIP